MNGSHSDRISTSHLRRLARLGGTTPAVSLISTGNDLSADSLDIISMQSGASIANPKLQQEGPGPQKKRRRGRPSKNRVTASQEMAAMLADSVREIAQTSVTSGDSSLIEQRIQRLSGLLRQLKHDLGCTENSSSSRLVRSSLDCSTAAAAANSVNVKDTTLKQANGVSASLRSRARKESECITSRGSIGSRSSTTRSATNKRKLSRLQTQTARTAAGHTVTQQRLLAFQENYLAIVRSTYFGHRRSTNSCCSTADASDTDRSSNNKGDLQWGDRALQPQQWRLLPEVGFLTSSLRPANPFERWSPLEIAQFEAGMRCWGKQFGRLHRVIRSKTTREVVEFYYTWKKTSHYAAWKRDYTPL